MKHFAIFSAFAVAAMVAASCTDDIFENQKLEEKAIDINVDNIVSDYFITVDGAGETVELGVNCPFDYSLNWNYKAIAFGKNTVTGKNSNSEGCSFEGNKVKVGKSEYTRDLAIDIKGKENFAWKEGSGLEFKYPVRIRQYGSKTAYLSGEDIAKFNNSTARMNEKVKEIFPNVSGNTCLYVLGTVKEAGTVYKYDGLVFDAMGAEFNDGEFFDPTFGYSKESMQLSAFDAVITVDGVDLKIRVQYPEAYKLVEKAAEKVKAGATVEFVFNQSGVTNGTNVLLLSPADIIVK